jgi:hypothetical protein
MFGLLTALFRSVPRRPSCADLLLLDDAWLRRADAAGRAAIAARRSIQ